MGTETTLGNALTERELEVVRGMSDGKSNAEIGRELFVSEDTVKTHARRLFKKLGARDRAHAVGLWLRSGATSDGVTGGLPDVTVDNSSLATLLESLAGVQQAGVLTPVDVYVRLKSGEVANADVTKASQQLVARAGGRAWVKITCMQLQGLGLLWRDEMQFLHIRPEATFEEAVMGRFRSLDASARNAYLRLIMSHMVGLRGSLMQLSAVRANLVANS